MKILNYKTIIFVAFISLFISCEKDFENVNQANENQVLNTKEGLIALSLGLTQHFATSTLAPIVEIPALSTRELGNLSTYLTPSELVFGGTGLPDDNAGIARLWARLNKDKKVAEDIIKSVDGVTMEAGTASGMKAYAKFFKAMTLGYLIQNFEMAPIDSKEDGQAVFSDRNTVLTECINLLESAKSDITTTPISDEFNTVITDLNLPNIINAYLARYNLYAGEYQDAINAANAVDLSSMSVWKFEGSNENPIWKLAVNGDPDTKPQDNFGLTSTYTPEATDGRIAFYLAPSVETETDYGMHGVEEVLGFFNNATTSIPVYLPGEILLIKAEAYAMQNDLPNAVAQINLVRTKTDDVFGVNAGLVDWTGDETNKTDILDEIYKNRCIELFMTGMRLEDSRRIHSNFVPSNEGNYTSERNRNYYPYPYEEKANNTNCPADPSI
jgi:hypothetical protein